jgi:plastocyanin
MSRFRLATGAATAALILIATAGSAVAANQAVTISGFAYSPSPVTVHVGDTVTWTNNDGATHTATADGGSFDTDNIANGASKSVTFSAAGTFAYHCRIHSAMHGSVVVQAAAGAATTPATDVAQEKERQPQAPLIGLAVAAAAGWYVSRRRFMRRATGS